jgi:hypothetical protein
VPAGGEEVEVFVVAEEAFPLFELDVDCPEPVSLLWDAERAGASVISTSRLTPSSSRSISSPYASGLATPLKS